MKHTIVILIALLAVLPAFSRDIKGRILDENDAPLGYANVVLYCDSTFIAGGISDKEGFFSIPADAYCDLTAKVSFVGYDTFTTTVPQSGDMGIITLTPSTVKLGEVVVKTTRPATTMKGNALVTNVEGSSLAIAGTANDVLVHVPMEI